MNFVCCIGENIIIGITTGSKDGPCVLKGSQILSTTLYVYGTLYNVYTKDYSACFIAIFRVNRLSFTRRYSHTVYVCSSYNRGVRY